MAMSEKMQNARTAARAIKQRYWEMYRRDPNVQGMAFGRRVSGGKLTEDPAIIVYVARKVPLQFLPGSRTLPTRLTHRGQTLEVDVVETGPFYPLSFTSRDRPAPSGISIGHVAITAGTLSCLVNDLTDRSLCILSNNHVLANENAATIGDAIVQPGPYDGGGAPADQISTLKRFVTIQAAGNIVDCAIAQVGQAADVTDTMKNALMPIPSPAHPAVGLLFAGSCNRTIMNPIDEVLQQLNIEFTHGPGATVAGEIDMNVEKVGRTTEYTTSTIMEIDATVNISYDFGTATFDHQIVTAWMSDGGDSGSIVCRGGAGGHEDHCGDGSCATTRAAELFLARSLTEEATAAQSFRDNYVRSTKIGAYLLDLFNKNEEKLLRRFTDTKVRDDDRKFAALLFRKHRAEAMAVAASPERAEFRVTNAHLTEAEAAFKRLSRYLTASEVTTGKRALKLAKQTVGKNVRDLLAMANDEELFNEVKKMAESVRFLK
jgi:hypothetical protein